MNKPEPDSELVVELSEACDRCLILYAVTDRARQFIAAECPSLGDFEAITNDKGASAAGGLAENTLIRMVLMDAHGIRA